MRLNIAPWGRDDCLNAVVVKAPCSPRAETPNVNWITLSLLLWNKYNPLPRLLNGLVFLSFFFLFTLYFLFYTLPLTLTSVWMEVTIEGNMLAASAGRWIHCSLPSGILEKCSRHAKRSISPNLTGIDYHSWHCGFDADIWWV